MSDDPYSRAEAAYAILKKSMDERFPHGRFVAIAGGKLVADAESIEGLKVPLAAIGLTLDNVAIDQAGIKQEWEYLGWTTTEAMIGHWIECVLPPEQ
jgi:hypothetical protein